MRFVIILVLVVAAALAAFSVTHFGDVGTENPVLAYFFWIMGSMYDQIFRHDLLDMRRLGIVVIMVVPIILALLFVLFLDWRRRPRGDRAWLG